MADHPPKSLSICMLSEDFLPGATGVGTHLQAICPELVARGHRVAVITTRRPGEPEREVWQGVQVFRVATVKLFGFYQALASARTIGAIFDEVRPDLVHHHYLGLLLLRGMRAASQRGLPQVYTYHMTEDHLTQPLPMRPLRGLLAREIVRRCNRMDLVISVSRNLARTLPAKGITAPVSYISNPVNFPDISQVEPAPRDAGFVVMFAGRLNPEKNLPLLLRGFAALRHTVPDASLWIAGEGAERQALEKVCLRLGIASQVRFLGFLDRASLAARYAACDVFVLPSLVETQGLVAMEAMRFGKPVIVARSVVSADELVDEGASGFIVDHADASQLGERLLRLATDAGLRLSMGEAGRHRSESFGPEQVLPVVEEVYSRVLRSHPRGTTGAGRHPDSLRDGAAPA